MTFPPAERLLRYQISCDATRTATRPGMPGRIFLARASGKRGCDSSTSQLERYCAIYQYVQRPTGFKLHGAAWSRITVFHAEDQDRALRDERRDARQSSTRATGRAGSFASRRPCAAHFRCSQIDGHSRGAIRRSRTCPKNWPLREWRPLAASGRPFDRD